MREGQRLLRRLVRPGIQRLLLRGDKLALLRGEVRKFGGGFKEKTVKKLSLIIEARLNGWDLTLSLSAPKPTSTSSLGSLGKPYEGSMRYEIDTSEISCGMRKLFPQIEYMTL